MSGERVLSARLEIEAIDKTGKIFADIAKRMVVLQRLQRQMQQVNYLTNLEKGSVSAVTAIDRVSRAMGKLSEAQKHLADGTMKDVASDFDRMANSAERAGNRVKRSLDDQSHRAKELSRTLKEVGHLAAAGVGVGTHYAYEKGADLQHTIVGLRNAGVSEADIQRAHASALAIAKDNPAMPAAETMTVYKEARSSLQHPEEAFELLPELARAKAVMGAMGMENANIGDIVKGAESLGFAGDKHKFMRYLNGQIKAMAVMGHTITTEQIYEAAKYSKSAGAGLSDEFINLVMPSLIQEMHGSSAGDALSMMSKTLRGGLQNRHLPVQRLKELGLLEDPSKIVRTKTGSIKGYSGKVKGDALLSSDPDKWFTEVFNPAAEKAGYKNLTDKTRLLQMILPSTAANLGRILLQQHETLAAHRKLYENAPDLDQASENNRSDPKNALNEVSKAMENFSATLTSPAMEKAAQVMDSIARALNGWAESLANWQKENPELAKNVAGAGLAGGAAVGALGSGALVMKLLGVLSGRGSAEALNGSAAALTSSAAALDAAAAKLAGGGAAGVDLPGDTGSKKNRGLRPDHLRLLGNVAAFSTLFGMDAPDIKPVDEPDDPNAPRFVRDRALRSMLPKWMLKYFTPDLPGKHRDWVAGRKDDDSAPDAALPIDKYPPYWLDDRKLAPKNVFQAFEDRISGKSTGFSDDSAHDRMLARKDADLLPDIKSALSGAATITVQVEPSRDFITRIVDMVKQEMSGFSLSGPGSTGQSSPDVSR